MRVKSTENEIVNAICEYLHLRRHFFWRQNTQPIWDQQAKSYRAMPKWSKKGVPDIIVIKDGYFIGLECKSERGKQSDMQKEFELGVREAGGEYYTVRSIEDVKEIGL